MTEFRYVPHNRVALFEADGWQVISDLSDCHHGVYAVLMMRLAND